MEFPTFPYDDEISDNDKLLVDRERRLQLSSVVDLYTSTSDLKSIDGKPFVKFNNRVDVKASTLISKTNKQPGNPVIAVAVANLNHWHGYDRMLKGMAAYLNARGSLAFKFVIAGDGKVCDELKSLSVQLGIQEYVEFKGFCNDEALAELYKQADIGISSLGIHRIGISSASPLKSRSYLCNGLPVVYSHRDDDLDCSHFTLRVAADESPVDIETVINFAQNLTERPTLFSDVQQFASQNLGWESYCRLLVKELGQTNQNKALKAS